MSKNSEKEDSDVIRVDIPVSIFCDRSLSIFEVLVEYLKEKGYSNKKIGELTNRSNRTIWTVFDRVKKKRKKIPKAPLVISDYTLPLNILLDRRMAVLEVIVAYLKEHRSLSYHDIGIMLNRDERTIWTVYNRSLKKR